MANYTKKQAISIVTNCAKKYETELNGKCLLFAFRNKEIISTIEASFMARNFLHLTGLKVHNITANDFYGRCLDSRLSEKDFEFSNDGTTQLKLEILPLIMSKNLSAKMIGTYNGSNPKLYTDKLAGGVYGCTGFIKPQNMNIYVPNTVLNMDIRQYTNPTFPILATYRKNNVDEIYSELVYRSKKFNVALLSLPNVDNRGMN